MSNTKVFPVNADFNMQSLVDQLIPIYQAKGFMAVVTPWGPGMSIDFRKDDDGITKWVGMALGVRANLTITNNTLLIDYVDAEWTGKIVAIAVGWIVCFIPAVLGIIGTINQLGLPDNISNDVQFILGQQGALAYGQPYQA